MDSFVSDVTVRPENLLVTALLKNFQIHDNVTVNTLYPYLAQVQPNRGASSIVSEPLMHLRFEHNPLDGYADDVLELVMRKIELVYSRAVFVALVDFFKAPEEAHDSLSALAVSKMMIFVLTCVFIFILGCSITQA
jgi:hypothetical protein